MQINSGKINSFWLSLVSTKVIFSMLVATLIGCSGDANQNPDTVTITFWHSVVSTTRPALKKLLQKFEADNPDLQIQKQYVPTGDGLVHKLVTAIQSQSPPDVSWIHADFMGKLVRGNAVYDMQHFIEGPNGLSDSEMADIFPQVLQNAKWQGKLYALPMEATSLALFYNKDMFRRAGLDPDKPPRTWQELRETARKLTVDKNGDGVLEQYGFYLPALPASGALSIWTTLQWTPYLWQAGGVQIDDAQSQALFNSDAGVQTLTFWQELYNELNLGTFTMTHDLGFAAGKLAMIMDGPWNLPRFRKAGLSETDSGCSNFRRLVIRLPGKSAPALSLAKSC